MLALYPPAFSKSAHIVVISVQLLCTFNENKLFKLPGQKKAPFLSFHPPFFPLYLNTTFYLFYTLGLLKII